MQPSAASCFPSCDRSSSVSPKAAGAINQTTYSLVFSFPVLVDPKYLVVPIIAGSETEICKAAGIFPSIYFLIKTLSFGYDCAEILKSLSPPKALCVFLQFSSMMHRLYTEH